jgi:hypothetical protein
VGGRSFRCADCGDALAQFGRNVEGKRRDVLLELLELRGSNNHSRHVGPVRDPIQCNLGHAAIKQLGDGFEFADDRQIARREGVSAG